MLSNKFRLIQNAILSLIILFLFPAITNAQLCFGVEERVDENNSEEVFVDIVTANFTNIATFQFAISFDTTHYEFLQLDNANLPFFEGNFSVNAGGTYGIMRIAWLDWTLIGQSLEEGKIIGSFKFKKRTDIVTPFQITDEPMIIEAYTTGSKPLDIDDCITGEPLVQYLKGRIIFDENRDCLFDEADRLATTTRNWNNWNNKTVQGEKYSYSGFLAEDGSYNIRLIPGENRIEAIPAGPYYNICSPPIIIDSRNFDKDSIYETLIQIGEECPYMQVNISTLPRGECEEMFLFIDYVNNGTIDATEANLEIDLDHRIEVLGIEGASLVELGGNKYQLDLGDFPYGAEGFISIRAQIPCDLLPEEVLCHEARIYPNEICGEVDEIWSGATLKVDGKCDGEEVIFEIENIGSGDMSEPVEYVVIEDAVILRSEELQLPRGASKSINLPAKGTSYYLQVPQDIGYPGEYKSSSFIEACGRNESGTYSTGFADLFPRNDNDPFIDINCHPLNSIIHEGAQMRAAPIGFGEAHFIEPQDFITYKLFFYRSFQPIEIIDTLSTLLDIATFQTTTSGLPYDFTLLDNVLHIKIDPQQTIGITSDFANFLEFKIKPIQGVSSGSQILNKATIYKEDRLPDTTNTTFHTIQANFLQRTTPIKGIEEVSALTITPNPSNDFVFFKLNTQKNTKNKLMVFNMNGQLIHTAYLQHNQYRFQKGDLPSGTYIYRLVSAEGIVDNGLFVLID